MLLHRREFAIGLGWLFAAVASQNSWGTTPPALGPPEQFSFDWLRARAAALALDTPSPAFVPLPSIATAIDYDAKRKIRFRPEFSLGRDGSRRYPVSFFPVDALAFDPVKVHVLNQTTARELLFQPHYFDFTGIDLPGGSGFSGFRLMHGSASLTDWLAFQGASYFRSSGSEDQYGASARGLAINTGLSTPEEFPRFSEFWLEETGQTVTIYALLEGPSVTGAYRFDVARGDAVVMTVHAELTMRSDVMRLGLAPLTSMYWYGENLRARTDDWRPEIHDSDGLSLWTGTGERIWRPLNNPRRLQVNSFQDKNPRGFGLMQRDRLFENYQDGGTLYNRRPGIWVEPQGDWGEGHIQLVEIPTEDETHDNIVAYWQPKPAVVRGAKLSLDYKIHWRTGEPDFDPLIARVAATRLGRTGTPNDAWLNRTRKFVIDFEGGPFQSMEDRYDILPIVSASRGRIGNPHALKVTGTNRWRVVFDFTGEGSEPVDLRCFLRLEERTLTETWLYQHFL